MHNNVKYSLNATEHFKMWILCYMYFTTIFKATILNLRQVPSFRLYEHLRGYPNDIPACLQQRHLHPSQSGRKVDHIPDQSRAQKAEALGQLAAVRVPSNGICSPAALLLHIAQPPRAAAPTSCPGAVPPQHAVSF